jgi:hypothetical protein
MKVCAPFTLASAAIRTDRRCCFATKDNGLTRLAAVVYVPLSSCRAYSVCLAEQRRRRYVKTELYEAVRRSGGAILISETSPHLVVAPFNQEAIFSQTLKVLALSGFAPFAVLQSRVHEIWARA